MPFIPRQVKPPARIAVTCKLPQHVATWLKCYAEFLDSSQEYVVTETLQLAFRKDREFHAWLATTHPDAPTADAHGPATAASPPTPPTAPELEQTSRRSRAARVTPERLATPPTSSGTASQEH